MWCEKKDDFAVRCEDLEAIYQEVLTELQSCPVDTDVEGGRCMGGSDEKLCFSEKEIGKYWKDYMERIMNEENDWDCNMEGDLVEAPVVCMCREMVVFQALNVVKQEKPLDLQKYH